MDLDSFLNANFCCKAIEAQLGEVCEGVGCCAVTYSHFTVIWGLDLEYSEPTSLKSSLEVVPPLGGRVFL